MLMNKYVQWLRFTSENTQQNNERRGQVCPQYFTVLSLSVHLCAVFTVCEWADDGH